MLELTVKKEIEVVIKATGDQVQVLSDMAEFARRWISYRSNVRVETDAVERCHDLLDEKRRNAVLELMSDIFEATK